MARRWVKVSVPYRWTKRCQWKKCRRRVLGGIWSTYCPTHLAAYRRFHEGFEDRMEKLLKAALGIEITEDMIRQLDEAADG